MIPLQLTVKNFMCYRGDVPPLELEGIHVACLCGDNGHGKSALLDAITWALWGEARARTQEELVHQGQTDMAVELDFLAQGQRYRVSRRHTRSARSRQGSTLLELQVATDEEGVFRPITGNTVRDTEARIREILHMDYNTFINTAFLRQGDADRFTVAKPTDRKQYLTEVLDLSYYRELEKRAKDKSNIAGNKMRVVENTLEIHRQEIARKPEYEGQLEILKTSLALIMPKAESQQQKVGELRISVQRLQGQRDELQTLTSRLDISQRDVTSLEGQVTTHQKILSEYQAILQRDSEIRQQFGLLTELQKELERLNQALSRKNTLDHQKSLLEREIAIQQERLAAQVNTLKTRVANELEPKVSRLPQLEEELGLIAQEEVELSQKQKGLQEHSAQVQAMEAELERLNQAFARKTELDKKKASVQQAIAVERERLTSQRKQLGDRVALELEPKANRILEIQERLGQTAVEEEALAKAVESLGMQRQEAQEYDNQLLLLKRTNEGLLKDMKEGKQKFDMLDQEGANCPVCNQPLGAEGLEHLRKEYESEGLEQKRQYKENEAQQKELSEKHQELTVTIASQESSLNQKQQSLTTAKVTLNRDFEDAQKASEALKAMYLDIQTLESKLEKADFAQDERQQLAELESEYALLAYDPEGRDQLQVQYREGRDQLAKEQAEFNEQHQAVRTKRAGLERDLQDSRQAQIQLEKARDELQQTEDVLSKEAFAQTERESLSQLDAEIQALGYDAEKHGHTQEQVKGLEEYTELNRKLQEAEDGLPRVEKDLSTTQQMLGSRQEEIKEITERKQALDEELKALPALEIQLQEAEILRRQLDKERDEALRQQGGLEQRVAECNQLEVEVKAQEKEHGSLAEEKGIYDELASAFGKNGIQAMMIESAIPQLEDDANELLGRLTENRMFLNLQLTEGRRVQGVPTEELDIKIADEIGTRSYETFSGGEAFRINFALRIALSKLLARRSGAPLPILFIDEGFGSQDRVGQERLTEAIQSIQEDFEKIIVITHIEQIKDAFPVRIEVSKNGDGSSFNIT